MQSFKPSIKSEQVKAIKLLSQDQSVVLAVSSLVSVLHDGPDGELA